MLRPSDGKPICTLITIDHPAKDQVLTLSLSSDRETVFFGEGGFGSCSGIYSAETRTGRVRSVVESGYDPAISPDGRFLAYNASFSCGDRRNRLVVRNLATDQEQEWIDRSELGFGDLGWGPDPRYLIVSESGADSASYFLLDTTKKGTLAGQAWPSKRALGAFKVNGRPLSHLDASLWGATVRPDHKTVLFGVWYSLDEPGMRHPIIEFDVDRETFRKVIDDAGGPVDFDPSGRAFLYRPLDSGLTLHRQGVGRSVRLGTGYYDAAW